MTGTATYLSFPFRIYSDPIGLTPVRVAKNGATARVSPETLRSGGAPLGPDSPFSGWSGFAWSPFAPKNERLFPPGNTKVSAFGNSPFYDAFRIDFWLDGDGGTETMFYSNLLEWLRVKSGQSWIGRYEPQTSPHRKFSFPIDGNGRAISAPFSYGCGITRAAWMVPVTQEIFRSSAEEAFQGSPKEFWSIFMDARLALEEGAIATSVILHSLALEVARDSEFLSFSSARTTGPFGPELAVPFRNSTDLLRHLSSDLGTVHPDGRNLEVEEPRLWKDLRATYIARHHAAHGRTPMIIDPGSPREMTGTDLAQLSDSVRAILLWIERLNGSS